MIRKTGMCMMMVYVYVGPREHRDITTKLQKRILQETHVAS
jgi:hypothetical protein